MINESIVDNYKKILISEALGGFFKSGARTAGRAIGKTSKFIKANPLETAGLGLAAGYGAYKANEYFNSPSATSATSMERREEKRMRKAQTKEMQARLRQEMANIRSAGESDESAVRAQAVQNLAKDKDFVAQANQMGYSVGKVSGSESGMFGYRHSTGAEAKKASDASRAQLFDAQGRAKVFERDPSGKLVGRDPTEAEVTARKQQFKTSDTPGHQGSRASYYGRLAQRGVNIFKEPRSLDQDNYRRAAERDIEREGPLDRYKNRVEVMKGMEERGFQVGEGDYQALYKEKKAQRAQADADLFAKIGDREPTKDELDELRKRYEEIEKNTTGKYYR